LFFRKEQELLQLAAEEFRAARIVESERRQRIEHPIAARIAAVIRFDADDRDDHFRRNAELVPGAVQRVAVLVPECDAGVDACGVEESRREFVPLGRGQHRPRHRRDHFRLMTRLGEQPAQRARIETLVGDQLGDERAHLGSLRVIGRRIRRPRRGQRDCGEREEKHTRGKSCERWMSACVALQHRRRSSEPVGLTVA